MRPTFDVYLWMVRDHTRFAHINAMFEAELISNFPLWTFTQPHYVK